MKKSTRYIVLGALVIIFVGLFVWYKTAPGPYDGLANYLNQSGVKMYGAFWCPHCQAEKKDFGKSEALLPYVECSMPDGQTQTQICIDQKIVSYPTWDFPNPIILSSGTNDSNVACKATYTAGDPRHLVEVDGIWWKLMASWGQSLAGGGRKPSPPPPPPLYPLKLSHGRT